MYCSFDVAGVRQYIEEHKPQIVVMCGAGISVASGIPDFRSENGLYSQIRDPQTLLSLNYYCNVSPLPVLELVKSVSRESEPSLVHSFLKKLHDRQLLLRVYTQNIDGLEQKAGVPRERIVQVHGTLESATCVRCKTSYSGEYVRHAVSQSKVPMCCEYKYNNKNDGTGECGALVKPDICLFGESLSKEFECLYESDFAKCELLIVIGTSLKVEPFASLIKKVSKRTPRVLINNEYVGTTHKKWEKGHFEFAKKERDVALIGDCQSIVLELL